MSKQISDDIKQFSYEICQKHKVIIRYMETDKDHIHLLIQVDPKISPLQIVRILKQFSTYKLWKIYREKNMKKFFYHEKNILE